MPYDSLVEKNFFWPILSPMGLSFTDLNKTLNIYMMIGKPLELIEINFCSCLNNELLCK